MTDSHTTALTHVEPRELQRMHPLVSAAMASGSLGDPATLRELLAVQREWEAGEARKSYTRALSALKRDLPTVIAKDATVDFQGNSGKRTHYTHATLAGVMNAITEPLTRHGFSLAWVPATGDRAVRVACKLTHAEGHFEECVLEAPADTSGSKSPAQAIASTITLLSRYTALALLGIATADMKEDTGEGRGPVPPSPAVDVDRNMRAAKWLADQNVAREDAERHVGRPVNEWTVADLDTVRAYGTDRKRRAEAIARGEDPDA